MSEQQCSDGDEEVPVKRRRGARRVFDNEKIFKVLVEYKEEIINRITGQISTSEKIWAEIAQKLIEMGQGKTAKSLYTYVSCDQDGVRGKLDPTFKKYEEADDVAVPSPPSKRGRKRSPVQSRMEFTTSIPYDDFKVLIEKRPTYVTDKETGIIKTRYRDRCLPGICCLCY